MCNKVMLAALGSVLSFFSFGLHAAPPEPNLSQRSLVPLADETLGVIYILPALAETGPRDPNSYIRTASEDGDLKPLREYLVLAKAIGEINGDILIDPDSVWLLPRGRGEEKDPWSAGIPRREVYLDETRIVDLTIPAQLHRVHGFGEPPHEFGDLRPFGFVVMRDPTMNWYHPLPVTSPSSQDNPASPSPRKPPSGKTYFGTELYIWGLADWGPENLVLRFEPAAELALATYNTLLKSNAPGILAVHEPGNNALVILAGFESFDVVEVRNLYAELKGAAHAVTQTLSNRDLLYASALGFDLFTRSIGLDSEELIRNFLQLAEAVETGAFPELYAELTSQGLGRFVEWLIDVKGFTEAEAKETVLVLSHYILVFAQRLGFRTSSEVPLEPKGYVHVLFTALKAFIIHLKEWVPVIASALETMETIGKWVRDPESMPDIVSVVDTTDRLLEALRKILLSNISREEAAYITNLVEECLSAPGPHLDITEQLNRLIILLGLARFFPPTPEGTQQYVEFLETFTEIRHGGWALGGIVTAERIGAVKKVSLWAYQIWKLNDLPASFPALVYWRFEPEPYKHWTEAGTWVIAAIRHFNFLDLAKDYNEIVR